MSTTPHCDGDVCITCSDTAVQVRVVELLPDALALVDTGSCQEEVSAGFPTVESISVFVSTFPFAGGRANGDLGRSHEVEGSLQPYDHSGGRRPWGARAACGGG